MTTRILLFFVAVLFQSCRHFEKDNEQIRACFANYKKAILNHKGKLGVQCVDSKSIYFYTETLNKVIYFDSLQIEKESAINKYTILNIRQNISYDSILQMNAKSLLVYLIDHGKSGNGNISVYNIGSIKIDEDVATVEKIIEGRATKFVFKFYKESNGWKLATFSPREEAFYNWGIKNAIFKSKLSEDEYILNYIDTTSKVKLKKDIWQPLLKK